MNAIAPLALTLLLCAAAANAAVVQGAPAAAGSKPMPNATVSAKAKSPALESTVTVHRCVDTKGHVTLQGDPCPKGSQDSAREMTRPKDPPRSSAPVIPPMPVDMAEPEPYLPPRELIPPPPMYRCTSYDGIERYSESYDPNPRCEPLVIYYPYPNNLTPAQALSCRWVEDSCVRLSDQAACARWKAKKKEAISAVISSFSDTAAYRKSELARINQIVNDSCP